MDNTIEIELSEIRPKVLAAAKRFFRSSKMDGDPEDVAQEVLLRLWEARRKDVPIRDPKAWAVAAARNRCVSLWRKRRNSQALPEWLQDAEDASARVELSEAADVAEKALERIPEGTRRLLRLRATGLSLDEIAAITGRPKGSVKSSISAARKEMMKSFGLK